MENAIVIENFLNELNDELINDEKRLENELKQIVEERTLVLSILELIEKRKDKEDSMQMNLFQEEKSTEYANKTFKEAALDLFATNPKKAWQPKEVTKMLLKKGFITKSKDFSNVARAMLLNLRTKGIIDAEKVKIGKQEMWRYSHKKQETIKSGLRGFDL